MVASTATLPNVSPTDNAAEYSQRLAAAAVSATEHGVDVLFISPGPDLTYLTGYDAIPLERLTCLVLPSEGDPCLVVPTLEEAAAAASPISAMQLPVHSWPETADPFELVASLTPAAAKTAAVDDRMWASKALALQAALPNTRLVAAGEVMTELRMRKSAREIAALQEAGEAIDDVHRLVPELLRPGRTEREVAADISDAILRGHARVDFVIVASGPNGASPHHESSDRVLEVGDAIVVDIGGTTAAGYCSDSTRTYHLGQPDPEYAAAFEVLHQAQQEATAAAVVGARCEAVDAAARDRLTEAGLGELFIHRTGHGIGLETHEEPYIVEGNTLPLEPGMAFSIEPGFYDAGRWGARIEDIVVCSADGPIVCNNTDRSLHIVDC